MSECVVRMEMPKNCDVCPCLDDYGDYPRCRISEEQRGYNFPIRERRMPNCPIICQLPEGHGRLVDADANFLGVIHMNGGGFANYNTTIAERLGEEDMRTVKVIVPAERSET